MVSQLVVGYESLYFHSSGVAGLAKPLGFG
jgi:hypothetical protein